MSAASETQAGLTGGEATRALAGLAVIRALRGRALWVALALTILPVIVAVVQRVLAKDSGPDMWRAVFETTLLILPVVPSVLIAGSLADELEEKTSAYLWSRALPRWSIVAGKLLGLAPICAAIMMVGATVGWLVLGGAAAVPAADFARGLAGITAGALAGSAIAAMWATLVPRHAVAVSVVWLLFLDAPLGDLGIRLHHISAAYVAHAIPGWNTTPLQGVLTAVGIIAVGLTVAIWRIGRME